MFTIKTISVRPSKKDCFLKIYQNLMQMVLLVSQKNNKYQQYHNNIIIMEKQIFAKLYLNYLKSIS